MTLEDAIRNSEEVAQKCEDFVRRHSCDRELGFVKRCQKCAEEQRQLAEWLRELQELKQEVKNLKESSLTQNALDTISRQEAIDAIANCTNCGDEKTLRAYVQKHNLDNGWTGGILEAIDAIEDLPSAQPEYTCVGCKHRGKWENEVEYGYNSPCTKCRRRTNDNYEQ